jgi:hypothetical protein
MFEKSANLSALLPLFFALYLPSIPAYGEHYGILFGFLLCLDIGLFVITLLRGPGLLHFAGGLSTVLVLAFWLNNSYRSGAWPGILAFIVPLCLLYLCAPILARRFGRSFDGLGERAVYVAPLLLAAFPVLAWIEPACVQPGLLFLILLLLAGAAAAVSLQLGLVPVHLVAASFVLLTEAAWGARHLTAANVAEGLAIAGILGLFFVAVPVLSHWRDKRSGRVVTREAASEAALYVGLSSHLLLLRLAADPALSLPPWGMFLVLACLNVAVGCAALYLRRGALHGAALAAAMVDLIFWDAAARVPPWPFVAIVAAGCVAAFAVAWSYLARSLRIEGRSFDAAAVAAVFLAQMVAVGAEAVEGVPGLAVLLVSHLILLASLLALAYILRWHGISLAAVASTSFATLIWYSRFPGAASWAEQLEFAAPVYLVFVAYPLTLGRRARGLLEPYLAAALAGAAFFFLARHSLDVAGLNGIVGILPLSQALLTGILLLQLLRLEKPGARNIGRLALVAGTVLAFLTVAVPLQLEKEWITVGWALEGAALAWLYQKIPHRGLLRASSALLALVFARLALNPGILYYYPRGPRIFNWYLYAYLISSGSLFVAGWLFSRSDDRLFRGFPRASTWLPACGTILLFLLLNIEIADFYSTGVSITFNFSATLAQDLTYTMGWALFGMGLLTAGIVLRNRPARMAAISLLAATILKCFLHDLARLGGLYRVGSFVALAICLALVAVLLQRFVLSETAEARKSLGEDSGPGE